jgi:hypothetical protein
MEKINASKNGTKKSHTVNVNIAKTMIEGTKYPDIQSAKS